MNIDKINELYKKKKEGTITKEEALEHDKLKKEYIESFRNNMRSTLENLDVLKEFNIDRNMVSRTALDLMLENDAIKQIKEENSEYIIIYDIKLIDENGIKNILKN